MRIKFWAALLLGVGVGALGGAYFGSSAIWIGAITALVGLGLLLVRPRQGVLGTQPENQAGRPRPTLSGLGTRVEQVLRLAEEQAADHRGEARHEAERILAEARAKANAILDQARTQIAETPDRDAPPEPQRQT